ncbi:MAG: monovalent cation/H(+) antiporter subunit G [Acidobacteriota bacterium]
MIEYVGMVILSLGVAFSLFGCLGLIRLPDVYNCLQAATKCVTLGTCGILLGILLLTGPNAVGLKALLCTVFLLLTAPVAAHAISRGSRRAGIRLWSGSVCDALETVVPLPAEEPVQAVDAGEEGKKDKVRS